MPARWASGYPKSTDSRRLGSLEKIGPDPIFLDHLISNGLGTDTEIISGAYKGGEKPPSHEMKAAPGEWMLGVPGGACQDTHISSLDCSHPTPPWAFCPAPSSSKATLSNPSALHPLWRLYTQPVLHWVKSSAVKQWDSMCLHSCLSVMAKPWGSKLGLNTCDPFS